MGDIARGEMWLVEEPRRSPRPHLVLTRTAAIPRLNQILVVPATRTIRGIPTEVYLDAEDGLRHPCVLSLDNVKLTRKAFCTRKLTTLSPARMHEVCEALQRAAGCSS